MLRTILPSFVLFFSCTHAFAFDLLSGISAPGKQKNILRYSGMFYENAEFPVSDATMDVQSFMASVPVYKTEKDSVSINLKSSVLSVNPEQNGFDKLTDAEIGFSYTHALEEKKLWSIVANYGSASDEPFKDASVSTLGITALYSYPGGPTSTWLLLVNYSNNRPILNNIPLPGFAYFYFPSKEFQAVYGIPFASVNWQFQDNWNLNFFTLIPWVVKTTVSYTGFTPVRIYAGVDFSQMTYLPFGRTNNEDRLFYDDKKAFLGVKSPLSQFVMAELEFGHAFDRSFFIAENYTNKPDDPVEIGNAYYGKLTLSVAF
ncbi:hypothetical protein [Bdellovibrio bacteriovorus]|uniref:hypothetical protein n=1 Tax=Bdellovibrio bacteriovorus TaxID=959 RepID=UPI0035A64CA0